MLAEGTEKAEAPKPPGAGIVPKPCPGERAWKKEAMYQDKYGSWKMEPIAGLEALRTVAALLATVERPRSTAFCIGLRIQER